MLMIPHSQVLTTDAGHAVKLRPVVYPSLRQVCTEISVSRAYLPGIFLIIITIFCFTPTANAAEFVAFRTTDIESQFELRYLSDERVSSSAGIETFSSQQNTYEEEFSVLTHNYVIHPNFLKLDLGAGVTLLQDSFETNTGSNENNDDLYSLQARASLLEKKPYPMSIYYTRDNPRSSLGLNESIQQTNTLYGFDFNLLQPLIPLQVNLFVSHHESGGSSPTRLIDETSDSFGIRASKSYTGNYSHQLSFDHIESGSGSGSLALPITPTLRSTEVLTYSSDWRFGMQHQIKYHDRATITKQDGVITRDEIRFNPKLTWKHSDRAQSSYSYSYLDSSQNSFDTTNQSANANLNYIYNEQTSFNTGVMMEDNSTTGVDNRSIGANGTIDYQRPLKNGTLTLSAGLDYRQNDRDAAATQANVIGEIITLLGLTRVTLVHEYIIPGSIVVQNLARSQTYIDGIDYRVIVIGSRSEIQRLADSNIGDPEEVVVDYAYQTGGSAAYTSLDQNYSAVLLISQYDLYLRYRTNDQNLTAGSPTLPLYSKNTLSFGIGTEYPLSNRIEIGADIDMIRQRGDSSPYDSQRYSVFGRFVLASSSNLRLNANRTIVDNLNSVENTDLTSFSMILRSRLRNRMLISAEAYTENDSGSSVTRKSDDFKLSAQWRVYQLTMNAEAIFNNDQTATTETEWSRFMVTLTRDI